MGPERGSIRNDEASALARTRRTDNDSMDETGMGEPAPAQSRRSCVISFSPVFASRDRLRHEKVDPPMRPKKSPRSSR